MHRYSYEEIQSIAGNILTFTKCQPKVGIICGSGLGGLADLVEQADVISYTQIPEFPVSTGVCVCVCVCVCVVCECLCACVYTCMCVCLW